MVEEMRSVSFPTTLRGYDREAVDAYVERVNRLIAELEISRSPESAVKHAVAEVTEQTRGILEQAHVTAEEITAQSRAQADDRLQLAEREGAEIREAAEARVRELDVDAEAIWSERLRLIADVRDVAERLLAVADDAAARFPEAQLVEDAVDDAETVALPSGEPVEAPFDAEAEGEPEAEAEAEPEAEADVEATQPLEEPPAEEEKQQ
jgi:DNA segregation ATPase FtsK/SpoIIIE, S-DNA-T family